MHPGEWLAYRLEQAVHADEVISASRPRLDSLLVQQRVVVKHLAGAETYDAYFSNEEPYGLAGKVNAELASAKLRREDAQLSLTYIQADLDAVEAFRSKVDGKEPGFWLEQWRTSRSIAEQALNETRAEYERVGERRRILDKDPVVPGSTARAAMDVAGLTAQPLYVFIDSLALDEARKEAVLSLFSALIFAPVLPSVEAAAEVATRLAQADIDVPVLYLARSVSFAEAARFLIVTVWPTTGSSVSKPGRLRVCWILVCRSKSVLDLISRSVSCRSRLTSVRRASIDLLARSLSLTLPSRREMRLNAESQSAGLSLKPSFKGWMRIYLGSNGGPPWKLNGP